jgi:hypothetical protein
MAGPLAQIRSVANFCVSAEVTQLGVARRQNEPVSASPETRKPVFSLAFQPSPPLTAQHQMIRM